jgi:endothelin-converting enzyme
MDDDTTKLAIQKVNNIVQKIGYPTKSPDIMNPPTLVDYYKSVNISSDAFFQNHLVANRFAIEEEWSALGKPVDRDQWGMTVPTGTVAPTLNKRCFLTCNPVNAYYNPPG